MLLAVDFDGVICNRKGIPTPKYWQDCKPKKGALETITELQKQGHTVYLFTTRADKEKLELIEWLDKYGFPRMEITNKKLEGTKVYIDDRALRFTNWNDIRKYFI